MRESTRELLRGLLLQLIEFVLRKLGLVFKLAGKCCNWQ
jgi:hypothetical protein